MKPLGVILIVLGVLALMYQGFHLHNAEESVGRWPDSGHEARAPHACRCPQSWARWP